MASQSTDEMKVVLEILVLCMVLDGRVSKTERHLYEVSVEAAPASFRRLLPYLPAYRATSSMDKAAQLPVADFVADV